MLLSNRNSTAFVREARVFDWLVNRHCPHQCEFTIDRRAAATADGIFVQPSEISEEGPKRTSARQLFFAFLHEAPGHPQNENFRRLPPHAINFTVGFVPGCDIRADYGEFPPRGVAFFGREAETTVEWAAVLEAVGAEDGARVRPAFPHLLRLFGACFGGRCPRAECLERNTAAFHFVFAFENAVCSRYVTENGFRGLVVPVVLRRADHRHLLPDSAFIAVDDFERMDDLAAHLRFLMANRTAYLRHFEWTRHFQLDGPRQLPRALCAACSKLHDSEQRSTYRDVYRWYSPEKHCDFDHVPVLVEAAVARFQLTLTIKLGIGTPRQTNFYPRLDVFTSEFRVVDAKCGERPASSFPNCTAIFGVGPALNVYTRAIFCTVHTPLFASNSWSSFRPEGAWKWASGDFRPSVGLLARDTLHVWQHGVYALLGTSNWWTPFCSRMRGSSPCRDIATTASSLGLAPGGPFDDANFVRQLHRRSVIGAPIFTIAPSSGRPLVTLGAVEREHCGEWTEHASLDTNSWQLQGDVQLANFVVTMARLLAVPDSAIAELLAAGVIVKSAYEDEGDKFYAPCNSSDLRLDVWLDGVRFLSLTPAELLDEATYNEGRCLARIQPAADRRYSADPAWQIGHFLRVPPCFSLASRATRWASQRGRRPTK
ncbi:hypothetical protein M3Y99_00764500 [Aphelenchoides fujianensis]|nr:hypothetical protein M3Y99_00764500 [Aphelenchoides fujianensis]